MKTKEELNALKKETLALSKKLLELTDEELVQVTGGVTLDDISHDRNFVLAVRGPMEKAFD